MYVEGDVLGVGRPMLVAEAVYEFPIMVSCEGMVSIGNVSLVCLITSIGILDLA